MKAINSLYYSSIGIFVLGFILKFFKAPYHTVIMLVGLAVLLVASVSYFIAKQKVKGLLALCALSTGVFLVAVLKFWPTTPFLAIIGFIIILTYILAKESLPAFKVRVIIPIVLLFTALGFMTMPNDERYYLLNIKYNQHADFDYRTWDKYSWFLNIRGKRAEAIEANNKAYRLVLESNDQPMLDLISQHKERLANAEWTSFK